MDILETIRRQIEALPQGPHMGGLKSVLRHIDAADRHLLRGHEQEDDSAFTDAIYRTNQAFEGSIKEAYRVLAEKDPEKKTPHDIALYLAKNNRFRKRVLEQFTTYRTEWRNPSTHDYSLDFDEHEAFLAIVSVSAFASLLIGEIARELAYRAVLEDQSITPREPRVDKVNLLAKVTGAFLKFVSEYVPTHPAVEIKTEPQLLGALEAFVTSIGADISVEIRDGFVNGRRLKPDMIVKQGSETVLLELRRDRGRVARDANLRRLEVYLSSSEACGAILLIYRRRDDLYFISSQDSKVGKTIKVISPHEIPIEPDFDMNPF
jgi:hypothetical protein